MSDRNEIVVVCSDGPSSRAIYHALTREFGEIKVVMEAPMSRLEMAKRRAKKLGYLNVTGQMMFVGLITPILSKLSRHRIAEIERDFDLKNDWGDAAIVRVDSINSDESIEILKEMSPRLIVVNGTRIISKKVLEAVDAVFINTHAGITPLYRGVHGAYWALAEDKPHLVGTTVHLVDKGIDTGSIIEQAFFQVTNKDNFATYPYLHTAHGIPILLKAVRACLDNKLQTVDGIIDLPSKLRFHPTIWQYVLYKVKHRVK